MEKLLLVNFNIRTLKVTFKVVTVCYLVNAPDIEKNVTNLNLSILVNITYCMLKGSSNYLLSFGI